MRGDNENYDLCEAATREGNCLMFPFPFARQLFAAPKKNFLFRSGKQECREGGILPKSGMRKLTILACPVW